MQQDTRRTTMAYHTQENGEEEAYNGQEEESQKEDMPYEYGQEEDELWGYHAQDNYEDHQPYVEDAQEESFALHVAEVECRNCHIAFSSNNRLHHHIRNAKCKKGRPKVMQTQPAEGMDQPVPSIQTGAKDTPSPEVVQSDATPTKEGGLGFRQWRYATAMAKLSPGAEPTSICLDSGCTMTLVDRNFLQKQCPGITILHMQSPLTVRGIGTERHRTSEYVNLDVYFPGKVNNTEATAHVTREAHIIDGLKANMLAGIDLLAPEGFVMDLIKKKATISSCKNITIELTVTPRANERVQRSILSAEDTTIPAYSRAPVKVSFKGDLPQDRDMLFEPQHTNLFAHIVDATISYVYATNASSEPMVIPAKCRLGYVTDCTADGYFLASPTDADLAVCGDPKANRPKLKEVLAFHTGIENELKLDSGVTVYGEDSNTAAQIAAVADAYPDLWIDKGNVANVPEGEWMKIPLVDNWQDVYKPANVKVYPLGPRNREVVDAQFDKLH